MHWQCHLHCTAVETPRSGLKRSPDDSSVLPHTFSNRRYRGNRAHIPRQTQTRRPRRCCNRGCSRHPHFTGARDRSRHRLCLDAWCRRNHRSVRRSVPDPGFCELLACRWLPYHHLHPDLCALRRRQRRSTGVVRIHRNSAMARYRNLGSDRNRVVRDTRNHQRPLPVVQRRTDR